MPLAYKPIPISQPNIDVKAFPQLFPDGKYGMNWNERKIPLSIVKYIRARLKNKDRRFATSMIYMCAMSAYVEQLQINSSIGLLFILFKYAYN